MNRSRLKALALMVVLAGCRPKGAPPAPLDLVLDSLAPGTVLGVAAAPLADTLHLPWVPGVGFGDPDRRTPYGLHGLYLGIIAPPSGDAPAPPGALVTSIQAQIPVGSAVWRTARLLSRQLGKAERWCQLGAEGRNVNIYFWTIDPARGVALRVGIDSAENSELMVGVPHLDRDYFSAGPCATPGPLQLDTAIATTQ